MTTNTPIKKLHGIDPLNLWLLTLEQKKKKIYPEENKTCLTRANYIKALTYP